MLPALCRRNYTLSTHNLKIICQQCRNKTNDSEKDVARSKNALKQTPAGKNNGNRQKDQIPKEVPEEPTTCCMSGCANCVWIEYAEKLSEYYRDGGEQAIKLMNEKISDPNIKAFVLHEIRMTLLSKK